VEDFFGAAVGDGAVIVGDNGLKDGVEIAVVAGGGHAEDPFGKVFPSTRMSGVLVDDVAHMDAATVKS
jgi:hypothetical protein